MTRTQELVERKARLSAQSDLQRMQSLLAWHSIRRIISPPPPPARSKASRSIAATLIGIALPLFGGARLGRVVRMLSTGATLFRVFLAWRAR
jgi:hypothetical protein